MVVTDAVFTQDSSTVDLIVSFVTKISSSA